MQVIQTTYNKSNNSVCVRSEQWFRLTLQPQIKINLNASQSNEVPNIVQCIALKPNVRYESCE